MTVETQGRKRITGKLLRLCIDFRSKIQVVSTACELFIIHFRHKRIHRIINSLILYIANTCHCP